MKFTVTQSFSHAFEHFNRKITLKFENASPVSTFGCLDEFGDCLTCRGFCSHASLTDRIVRVCFSKKLFLFFELLIYYQPHNRFLSMNPDGLHMFGPNGEWKCASISQDLSPRETVQEVVIRNFALIKNATYFFFQHCLNRVGQGTHIHLKSDGDRCSSCFSSLGPISEYHSRQNTNPLIIFCTEFPYTNVRYFLCSFSMPQHISSLFRSNKVFNSVRTILAKR